VAYVGSVAMVYAIGVVGPWLATAVHRSDVFGPRIYIVSLHVRRGFTGKYRILIVRLSSSIGSCGVLSERAM
jgi:hypothetical protein